MDEQEMLDFVKALSDTDRLRIVGLLTRKAMRAAEIAEAMKLPLQDTIRHLFHLEHGNIVMRSVDGIYSLDNEGLEKLARHQLEGTQPTYLPDSVMKEDARKVLAAYLNPDSSIKQIPSQAGKKKIILDYVINAFEPGKTYKEREVNLLLARFNKDTSSLRRYLVDAKMLERERDGSKYWRPQ
jgi:predicted transcriptional regulator